MRVVDKGGGVLFTNRLKELPELKIETDLHLLQRETQKYDVLKAEQHYIITLPLKNKFETVGRLELISPAILIDKRINSAIIPVVIVAVCLLFAYLVFILLVGRYVKKKAELWLNAAYGAAFLITAIVLMTTLIGLLSSGIQEKSRALTKSLSARLNAAVDMGIDLSSFSEIDVVFKEYQELNPEIEYIALTRGGIVVIHTDINLTGSRWDPQSGIFEYAQTLETQRGEMIIRFGLAKSLLYNTLWRYGKDFIVLLVASAFLSILFLNLAVSFRRATDIKKDQLPTDLEQSIKRDLIKPVYFLAVFMEGLQASFLPQYIRGMAEQSQLGAGSASAVFMIYFAAYTLCIIPAGWLAEKRGAKPLIAMGVLFSAGGLAFLSFVHSFGLIILFRMLSGAGQGLLFIGVQSYILRHTTRATRTRGGTIIVYGYNGGTLSGAAIGAMLALYIGRQGVFMLGAIVGFIILAYTLRYITFSGTKIEKPLAPKKNFRSLLRVFADFSFLKTVILVGIPTKIILTGITVYALPLLLASLAFRQEDIGQILMFYAAGVLLSSRFISRLTDRSGRTKIILFIGMLGAGVGLVLTGLMKWEPLMALSVPFLSALVVMAGMFILGFSHGFIHAPIVTHIADTKVARTLGQAGVTSFYRFLERLGHVTGPLIISSILLAMNESTLAISVVGFAVMIFGALFMVGTKQGSTAPSE